MRFDGKKISLTDEEWKARLPPDKYEVLRKEKTEPPFQNEFCENKQSGLYSCGACGLPLFESKEKFDSGTGWPSFTSPIYPENISYKEDHTLFLQTRIEVICSRCDSHLGHVFDDGPPPTGKRYCLNSLALNFIP